MRKNYTHTPKMPSDRNEFIDCLKSQTSVIVIRNDLIELLGKEINKSIGNRKGKNVLRTVGITALLIFNLYNPLTWLFGIGAIASGGLLKNEIKKYKVHLGQDVDDKEIIVLIHKGKVDEQLDSIAYDNRYVKSVETKEYKKRI